MADFTFELYNKYWPMDIKTSTAAEDTITTLTVEQGVSFVGKIVLTSKLLPQRVTVTLRNVSKVPTIDHKVVAERLGLRP